MSCGNFLFSVYDAELDGLAVQHAGNQQSHSRALRYRCKVATSVKIPGRLQENMTQECRIKTAQILQLWLPTFFYWARLHHLHQGELTAWLQASNGASGELRD